MSAKEEKPRAHMNERHEEKSVPSSLRNPTGDSLLTTKQEEGGVLGWCSDSVSL